MKQYKNMYMWLVLALAAVAGLTVTSCNDDMAEENYYTFTGEMMSDYLQNSKEHPEFSDFAEIVKRASGSQRGVNIMDLLSVRGQYTCFAPTNEAVKKYLVANGYASISDIPVDICDTIARTHLVNGRVYNTVDFANMASLDNVNMNDRYLTIEPDTVVDEETSDTLYVTYKLNRSGEILFQQANDSVENGIVQPVNAVLSASNQTLPDLMLENPNISLFNEALEATGIAAIMRSKIKDATWNPDAYEDKHVYSGGQMDYCHVPQTKKYAFTAFACPDNVLSAKYGISDLKSFYEYAQSIYGGDDWATVEANPEKMKEWRNPLRRLIGYNCLDRLGMYDQLTTICTIATEMVNPTEWYSTMDSLTTLKCERLTVSRFIGYGENDKRNDLYLNRGDMSRNDYTPGVHVERSAEGGFDQTALNGVYYTTDGLLDFGDQTKEKIFNTRMRMDLYTMFPEMMTYPLRDGRTTNRIGDSDNPDPTVTSPNYWFPNGYLDNVSINEDGIFLFQSQHNTYWSYEGDEFNLASEVNSYDITFNLPSVPTGTYQIRLGFANMPTRGVCQFYLDGNPQGTPFDMRDGLFTERTGWFDLLSNSYSTKDELEAAKKNMHNLGWYHGPRSVFCMSGEGHPDGSNNRGSSFCSIARTCRYVLCTATLDENVQHTVRIKSVWAVGTALVMLDYIELVPKSVYGVEGDGKAEDDY
ncbi:MAG: fasciclin domain-containing protein [Bacteroidaceae bacterium]|nr:fasciclin domain-containing protein [Bacteroidaceae bacterium]